MQLLDALIIWVTHRRTDAKRIRNKIRNMTEEQEGYNKDRQGLIK